MASSSSSASEANRQHIREMDDMLTGGAASRAASAAGGAIMGRVGKVAGAIAVVPGMISERLPIPHIDRKRIWIAWTLLGLMVLNWVFMAEVLQAVEHKIYYKPCYMTWFIHNSGLLWFIPWAYLFWRKRSRTQNGGSKLAATLPQPITSMPNPAKLITGVPLKQMLLSALGLSILIFFVEYFWYLSLPRISVTSNTAVNNSCAAFVFLFSILMLGEIVTPIKLIAVSTSLLGVFVVAFSGGAPFRGSAVSTSTGESVAQLSSAAGFMFVSLSTIGYALYQVLYRKYSVDPLRPHNVRDTLLFLGLVGFFNFLLLWVFFAVWNIFGIESYESPTGTTLLYLVLLGCLDATQNLLILLAIINSSPLFVSVGLLLTIPAAMFFDLILYGYLVPLIGIIGICVIVTGFVTLNYGELVPKEQAPSCLQRLFTPCTNPNPYHSASSIPTTASPSLSSSTSSLPPPPYSSS
ncbi:DUF6 domain protein [Pelomyxa schiedti]|nr:DUF6 domain protein [Pelomyxa schiedti]